jgi:hypothetical protein
LATSSSLKTVDTERWTPFRHKRLFQYSKSRTSG